MKAFPAILFLAFALGIPGRAEQQNKGTSPDGSILFEARSIGQNLASGAEREIFLSLKDPINWVSLCETPGWGSLELHFSPNNEWLIVQDGGASLGISLSLFHRTKGAKFTEKAVQLNESVERLALEMSGVKKGATDHRYLRVVGWSNDSRYVVLQLSGHGPYGLLIRDWLTIYEVTTGKFSFDLSVVNAGAVERPTEK